MTLQLLYYKKDHFKCLQNSKIITFQLLEQTTTLNPELMKRRSQKNVYLKQFCVYPKHWPFIIYDGQRTNKTMCNNNKIWQPKKKYKKKILRHSFIRSLFYNIFHSFLNILTNVRNKWFYDSTLNKFFSLNRTQVWCLLALFVM